MASISGFQPLSAVCQLRPSENHPRPTQTRHVRLGQLDLLPGFPVLEDLQTGPDDMTPRDCPDLRQNGLRLSTAHITMSW